MSTAIRKRLIVIAMIGLVIPLFAVAPAGATDPPSGGTFVDDDLIPAEGVIEAIAALGVTKGCNPPVNDQFCPDRTLTRAEMASIFERDIDALATAGITNRCSEGNFCPASFLPRWQMATFIAKALGLTPMVPPERPPPPYPNVGDGKRIIYANSQQHVWLIDENNQLIDHYPVSGRVGIPHYGTYAVYSKSVNAWAPYGGITMKNMVWFVRPGKGAKRRALRRSDSPPAVRDKRRALRGVRGIRGTTKALKARLSVTPL